MKFTGRDKSRFISNAKPTRRDKSRLYTMYRAARRCGPTKILVIVHRNKPV